MDNQMDENIKLLIDDKIKELMEIAKNKKNMLEFEEVKQLCVNIPMDERELERIVEILELQNIDVLRIVDNDEPDEEILLAEEEEEVENIDLSVPDGISIEDPVRMYLKEIGKVALLSADRKSVV